MSKDPFDSIFGNLDGDDPEEVAKAAQLEYEGYLVRVRAIVDTHIQGFLNLGYTKEEALYFGGQLHVLLLQLRKNQ